MMAGKDKVIAASLKSKLEGIAGEILPETVKAKMQAGQKEKERDGKGNTGEWGEKAGRKKEKRFSSAGSK